MRLQRLEDFKKRLLEMLIYMFFSFMKFEIIYPEKVKYLMFREFGLKLKC